MMDIREDSDEGVDPAAPMPPPCRSLPLPAAAYILPHSRMCHSDEVHEQPPIISIVSAQVLKHGLVVYPWTPPAASVRILRVTKSIAFCNYLICSKC